MEKIIYAVIPARGGSKGILGKNLRLLGGKPLLAYTILAAQASESISRIFVSTDSEDIAAVAMRYGAETIPRPKAISGDEASSEQALIHALEHFESKGIHSPDILVMAQCTSPFMQASDIDGTVSLVSEKGHDSAFAAAPFHHFLWANSPIGATPINHDGKIRLRRQDLEPQFLEAGSVYAMRVDSFLKEKTRFCGRTSLYFIDDAARALEIDAPYDLIQAQAYLEWKNMGAYGKDNASSDVINRSHTIIHALVMDFDGVFTDNHVYVNEDGTESVRCDRSDGEGLSQLKKAGILPFVISAEKNPVVSRRCEKLGIECVQNVSDKAQALSSWLASKNLAWKDIAYVGNDASDVECLKLAGMGLVPSDAQPAAKEAADKILTRSGGCGAIREACEIALSISPSCLH